jgi:predicted Zn-ribbon and HTH transcriptional regulator
MESKEHALAILTRECLKCKHKWVLRKPLEPKICPRCKSFYWDRERLSTPVEKKIEEAGV